MNWLVYKHISPSNKVYIGITHLSLAQRWVRGKGYKQCPLFYRAINKYGWDNFEHKIVISNLTEEQAKEVEIQLILYYKSINMSYNVSNGGDGICGYKHSDDYKKRMRLLQLGKPKSKETIAKQLETKRANPYHHTEDAKRRIAEAAKKTDHSKATLYAKIANSNAVYLRTLDNQVIEFASQREAAKKCNISEWSVSISIKENRFIKKVNGCFEAKLK